MFLQIIFFFFSFVTDKTKRISSLLVHAMACHQFGTKPYLWANDDLNTDLSEIWIKMERSKTFEIHFQILSAIFRG